MSKLAFIFILFEIYSNAEINEINQSQDVEDRNDFVRGTFHKLLKSIVNINKQRFDAIKKLTKLQDFSVPMDALRNGNNDDTISGGSMLAFVILDEGKHEKLRAETERKSTIRIDSSDSSESGSSSEDKNSKNKQKENSLRLWKSCQKKAAKVCRKACIDAYKTTCSEYACSKSMKKTLKKECKIACQNRFH